MKKRLFSMMLVIVMVIGMIPGFTLGTAAASPTFSGGSGTESDPYLISTKEDLFAMGEAINADASGELDAADSCGLGGYHGYYFKQTADIDLTGVAWAPFSFCGVYDGNGFEIQNLSVTEQRFDSTEAGTGNVTANEYEAAFFGQLVHATVKNLTFTDCSATIASTLTPESGRDIYVGVVATTAIAARFENVSVVDCVVEQNAEEDNFGYAGGLVGYADICNFTDCTVDGTSITIGQNAGSSENAGGIVGGIGDMYSEYLDDYNMTIGAGAPFGIYGCSVNADISVNGGSNGYAGGITGWTVNDYIVHTIEDCYVEGDIIAGTATGICGYSTSTDVVNTSFANLSTFSSANARYAIGTDGIFTDCAFRTVGSIDGVVGTDTTSYSEDEFADGTVLAVLGDAWGQIIGTDPYPILGKEQTAPTTYTVTVDDTIANGTVEADVSEAAEGETVTLEVTPASGFEIDTVSYNDGTNDTAITATEGIYSFMMPASNVTVTATFKVITEHTINWSGPADVVNTPEFDLMPYMPDDVEITGFSQVLSTIISGITPTYSTGVAKVELTTNTFEEPASGTVSATFKTEQYGDITFNINITLTGKYIVNISALPKDALYDGNAHRGYSNLSGTLTSGASYEGTYSYSYETADGTALDGAPTEVGDYKVTIAVPDDNENYKGSLTLEFSIKDASEPEASYQSEENGEWISGTLTEALTSVYEGGTVKLLKDVILTDTVTVAKNVTITSDNTDAPCTVTSETDQHEYLLKLLADVTLENIIVDGGSGDSITASRAMIEVGDGTNFGKLTLGTGAILRNNNNTTTNGAGGAVCVKLGDLVVSGGQISGNTAYSGSAIATVNNNNNVTIETGSVISGNNATNTDNSGGAIYISAGIVTMTGGEIKNNTAVNCGGAVFINKASTTSNATFKLQGGSITGNTAKYGGGIYISNAKLLKLSGGSVTGNTASSWGGGLLVAPNASVEISGSINISGNTNSSDAPGENLYLDGYEYNGINMPTVKVSKLDSTANVDMYSWLKPAAGGELLIASPADEYTLTADDLDKLSYEDTNYSLKLNDSGNVVLTNVPATVTYTVTVNTANNGTVVVNPTTAAEGDTVTLAVTPAEGYELQSLTVDGDDVTDGVNEGVYTFEMPAYDVTVTATFKEIASDADLLISSVAELEAFRDAVNGGNSYEGKVVKLTKSLDLSGVDWTPIGETGAKFKGTFDGGYHVIDGLTIESEAGFTGFFGRVEDATIKNLGIVNAVVSSSDYDTAILAANTIGGSIENCFVTGKASGYAGVGGIIGSTHGSSNPTTVKNCYVRATLEYADARGDCAGIAGWNYSGSIKIINSYSACIGEVRPIAGWSDGADVANSNFENVYFDKDLSPDFSSTAGRTDLGRTSEELQNESTFENYDFTNIWDIDPDINGGYPYLLGFDNVVLSGAPGTFTVILTDENGVAVTDVDVVITSDSATITLVHQGNGIYSASVPNEEAEYSINVNSDELATASHNGTETLVLEYQVASSTPTEYTVTFMDGGEVFTTITVPEGGTLAMTGMPIPDMPAGATLFGGWYTEDGDFVYHGMTVTSDMTAYPTWIAVETDGNGTVSVQRDSSDLSQMIITATPNGGYALDILAVEDADGGNIDVSDNKFTKPASDITIKVTFKTSHAHPVCGTSCDHSGSDAHESVTWTAWESTDSMPSTAGNYYLTANVTVSAEWTVPSGETLICLNGKTLKTTKINISDGNTLSVSDCGAGAVTSNGGYGASRPIVANDGTFCLYGGSITGNTNWYGQGGGVVNNGTFNMYGGSITRNSTDVSYAGGVLNNSGAIFNMYGGSITKNSAGGSGGGLYNSGKFNMYGGEITENTANVSSYGGVYSAGSINISGKVVISGNKNADGDPSNYCLPNSGAVMVVGTLESGSSIGVTHFQKVGTITTGGADYIDYFFSDNEQYFVEKDGDNLKLSEKVFTVTVTSNNTQYGTASANKASGVKGTFVTLSATPADGYRLKEWQVVSGGVTVSSSNTFVIGTADVEIMAIFEEASVITVTADPTEGGTVAGGGTYEKNTSVTVTATANDGYKFVGWYENGNEVSTAASYTFTATEARELTAKFVKLYTVTYHINNGTDEATVKTYADGDEITLPGDTFTYGKCEIEMWNTEADGSGDSYAAGDSYTVTGNADLYASWVLPLNELDSFTEDGYEWSGNGTAPYTFTMKDGFELYARVIFPANSNEDKLTVTVDGDCKIYGSLAFVTGTGWYGSSYRADITIDGDGSLVCDALEGSGSGDTLTVLTDVTILSDYMFIGASGGMDSKIVIKDATLTLYDLTLLEQLVMEGAATLNINGKASFHSAPVITIDDTAVINIVGNGTDCVLYKEGDYENEAFDALVTNGWLPEGYSFNADGGYYYLYDDEGNLETDGVTLRRAAYTITFDSNGGSAVESITQYAGTAITPPALPVLTGYRFTGWQPALPGIMPVGGLNVVAQWVEKAEVAIETGTQTYIYDGLAKAFAINGNITTDFTVTYQQNGQPAEPIKAGTYDVIITRAEDDTYKALSVTLNGALVISPMSIERPAQAAAVIYDGEVKTYGVHATAYYTVTNNVKTDANEDGYDVVIALTDKENTVWNDGSVGDLTHKFIIMRKEITEVVGVTAPVAAQTPETTVSGDNYSGRADWTPADGKFAYYTEYSVVITLTADDNYKFADGIALQGYAADLTADNSVLTLEKTFERTAKAKILSVTPPSFDKLAVYGTAADAISALPTTVLVVTEEGNAALPISWECQGEYIMTPEVSNTFKWTADIGNYDPNGQTLADTMVVVNVDALGVVNTATPMAITYDTSTFDVSTMFTKDQNAGEESYSIVVLGTVGEGAGTIGADGKTLTITKAGVITVEMYTAPKAAYDEGRVQTTLTVNLGIGAATVTMDDWTYGEAAKTPVPASSTNGVDNVTYVYVSTDGRGYNSDAVPTTAGDYKVIATFAATDLYDKVTAEDEFTVEKADPEIYRMPEGTRVRRGQKLGTSYITDGIMLGVDGERLDGTFRWEDHTLIMDTKGNITVTMVFTPDDTVNYNALDIPVVIEVYSITVFIPATPHYKVEFDTDGAEKIRSVSVMRNDTVDEPDEPAKEGFTFDGWYADAECTVPYDFDSKVTEDMTLYAKWIENEPAETEEPTETEEPEAPAEPDECDGTAEDNCPSLAYSDLDTTEWYHLNVDYVLEKGLMNGVGEGIFAPDGTTTRAMIVTILWRLENKPVVNYLMQFEDVKADAWYTEAIRWATSEGIVLGYSQTAFGPDDNITREQLATILYRYAKYKGYDVTASADLSAYIDAGNVSDWALEALKWANGAEIVNGLPGSILAPAGNATRAQAATMITRFIKGIQ